VEFIALQITNRHPGSLDGALLASVNRVGRNGDDGCELKPVSHLNDSWGNLDVHLRESSTVADRTNHLLAAVAVTTRYSPHAARRDSIRLCVLHLVRLHDLP
jgi:hypothetical protein